MNHVLRPWQTSLLLHALLAGLAASLLLVGGERVELIDVPVEVNVPQEVQNLTQVDEKPKVVLKSVNEAKPLAGKAREVFGTSRNSYTDKNSQSGVEAKAGNTLAKAADQEVLRPEDADALPVPTEEYLVSEMPVLVTEVKPTYPKQAREQRQEGVVELDILIDDRGTVRQASLVSGPEVFRSSALEAIYRYKFRPAKVDGKPVAVKVRFKLNFNLEY